MALSKEIYKEFEDIVKPENISDDPALLDSYIYPMSQTSLHLGPYYRVYSPRGAAVILPGSTEEVQGVVRLCN
jgi:glycolate oxidase